MAKSIKQAVENKQQTKPTVTHKKDQVKYEDVHFVDSTKPVWNYSLFLDEDLVNFANGTLYNAFEKFGSHFLTVLQSPGF